ncbi:ribosylglycohydrolase [Knoellia sinensis KCTC 19936]|uniref:Ribosylglycohydrolase n=1 Tax=Knoellia sinensis KCTC 19936 TaxID=1385520 RepID=A0A0A0J0G0_9MICO|nr:ADP-ribosylglycohydrolase family protein [Knoellia sinensis]KGN30528.1 ribosylglycohydrolase [Knoellia sinensis KCTC 19936]
MQLTPQQEDRAAGVLLGQAIGDALGVPYEFAAPPSGEPGMVGGGLGGFAPGEWSDDTQMAACIARVSTGGRDLTSASALDEIATAFEDWYAGRPADVGNQTRAVLTGAKQRAGTPAERLRAASAAFTARTAHAAGNGALMRTGIVGLTRLHDPAATAAAARAIAELTHPDPLAVETCILWAEAVRVAVLEGRFDLAAGVRLLAPERRDDWLARIEGATGAEPKVFSPNGFTVPAMLCAWAAITSTEDASGSPEHVQRAFTAAVHAGNDTDTVAAIAGALLGARYGVTGLPARWRRSVHGWPGLRGANLLAMALTTARRDNDESRWPSAAQMDYRGDFGSSVAMAVPHPFDEGVLLGTWQDFRHVDQLGVDAVVSLCRVGTDDLQAGVVAPENHVRVWLIDSDDPKANQHLDFVLDDTADVVRRLRAEGKRVLLHCVAAQQRTPSVAVRYATKLGVDATVAARAITSGLPSVRGFGLVWSTALGGSPARTISSTNNGRPE